MTVQIDTTAEIDGVRLKEQGSNPSNPTSAHQILFVKSGGVYVKDSSGTVTGPFGTGSGSVPTGTGWRHVTTGVEDGVASTPTYTDVGADVAGAASTVQSNLNTHTGLTTTAHGGIVASTDARLTDARAPTAHATNHKNGGGDEVATATPGINSIPKTGGASSQLAMGWLASGTPDGTKFVRDDGTLAVPAGASGVTRSGSTTDGHLAVWNGSNADSIKDGGAVPAGGSGISFLTQQVLS